MNKARTIVFLMLLVIATGVSAQTVPGTVIHYAPAAGKIYIGSAGIVALPNGDYLAKCDEFGPNSSENQSAITHVFHSGDKGKTWSRRATLSDMYWATIFVHQGAVYLLGNHKQYGDIVISRSVDNGITWTKPGNAASGRLKTDDQYHCAPVPVLVHNGRIWRAMERMGTPGLWGSFQAGVMSAPLDSDLLQASSWTYTNFLAVPADSPAKHWLEGNVVAAPDGSVWNILRCGHPGPVEKAAVLQVSADGRSLALHAQNTLIDMPGAAGKKFTIRYDSQSKRYWALVNPMLQAHRNDTAPGSVRNALALISSADLVHWQSNKLALYHPDTKKHAFQYPDWVFDGPDILIASRTAYDDDQGGAHNYHDANYLTFHRLENFRALANEQMTGAPELPPAQPPAK